MVTIMFKRKKNFGKNKHDIMIEPFPVVQADLLPVLLHPDPQHHRRRLADLISEVECVGEGSRG